MSAVDGARADLGLWRRALEAAGALAARTEHEVTGFDPTADLDRRGRWWGHRFEQVTLADVLAFGVALAEVEVEAWENDDPSVATRAFADRRFLFGDRVVHWAVPLTYSVADGDGLRENLLTIGDRLRPAPALTGDEGLHPPGEDSFGPLELELAVDLGPETRWQELAERHPGTARLWRDLAGRAAT